jgi:hypothetical protein
MALTPIDEAPVEGASSISIEAALASLVDLMFRDGRYELARAKGKRGVLRLNVEMILGDAGIPVAATRTLTFEQKHHFAKDPKRTEA